MSDGDGNHEDRRRRVLKTAGILFGAAFVIYLMFVARGMLNYFYG